MRKNTNKRNMALLLALITLVCALSGCYDTVIDAEESLVQTSQPAEIPADLDSTQRDYRTQIKGGGEDVVTLMLYLCGSDLESRGAAASRDLLEIVEADISDNLNIIVETGGAKEWALGFDATQNQRWQARDNDLYLLESLDAKNMSKGSTLQDFITYSAENFPADRYMLMLWDHGGGTVGGFAYDERFGGHEMMSIAELDSALAGAGVAFDMIGFDCCLMSTVETAFMIEKHADYMVASQRVEPGNGWHYTPWINGLSRNTSISTEELGKLIVDSYIEESKGGFAGNELTLSVTDLTYIPMLFDSLYNFLPMAQVNLLEGDMFVSTSQALSGSRAMQASYDLIDLSYLIETMGGSGELLNLVEQCIVYNNTTIDNHNGLCMYIPYTDLGYVADALNICNRIGIGDPYQDFIASFANMMLGGQAYNNGGGSPFGDDSFDLNSWVGQGWADENTWSGLEGFFADYSYDASELYVDEKGDDFVLNLPDEQWELITAANLRVFADDGEGFIDLGADGIYEFDDDGDLLVQFDYYWVALDGQIVCFYQEDEDYDEEDDYWYSYGVVPIWFEEEEAELVVVWDSDNPDGYVAGWRYTTFGGETQKGLFALEDGMYFNFLCDYYTYDGEYDDMYFFGDMTVNGEVTVSYEEINEEIDCWIYYELYDIFNNSYWTEYIVYGEYEHDNEVAASDILQGFVA